jgi:hypothetical protein
MLSATKSSHRGIVCQRQTVRNIIYNLLKIEQPVAQVGQSFIETPSLWKF